MTEFNDDGSKEIQEYEISEDDELAHHTCEYEFTKGGGECDNVIEEGRKFCDDHSSHEAKKRLKGMRELLKHMKDGASVAVAASKIDYHKTTPYRWAQKYPDFGEIFYEIKDYNQRVKEEKTENYILESMEEGDLPPRVALNYKKHLREIRGDNASKQEIEVNHNVKEGLPQPVEELIQNDKEAREAWQVIAKKLTQRKLQNGGSDDEGTQH